MIATHNHLKLVAIVFTLALLFQNCKVYQSKTISVDEAASSLKRVKVKSITNETYKFKSLEKRDNQLYGFTRNKSKTAKLLSDQIIETSLSKNQVKILLTEKQVNEIHLINQGLSDFLTVISIPVGVYIGGILIIIVSHVF